MTLAKLGWDNSPHPNVGRPCEARLRAAEPREEGRWEWLKEVQPTLEEVVGEPGALRPHRSAIIAAKRRHRALCARWMVMQINREEATRSPRCPLEGPEKYSLPAEIDRRWTNAQQRLRRAARRLSNTAAELSRASAALKSVL